MKKFELIFVLVVGLISSGSTSDIITKVDVLQVQGMTSPSPEIMATSLVFTYPPSDPGFQPHFHSGPMIGEVREGEFLFKVEGEPIRVIPTGSAFYVKDRLPHVWAGNASNSTSCKVFVTIFGRPGEDILTPIKNYVRESYSEAQALAKRN